MTTAELTKVSAYDEEQPRVGLGKYFHLLLVVFILMSVAIAYVWSHLQTTSLNYQIAEAISINDKLLAEQARLKVEYATLKSPGRIEAIARDRLQMSYPERDQVVLIKPSGSPQ